jgi:uncharacterized protein (DUF58 family)
MNDRRSIAPGTLDDPELFLAIEDLELAARGIVEGTRAGAHRSPLAGPSCEFEAHRPYHPGDDLRHVNWNLWARTDQMFVKQYRTDTNLQLYLVLDASGSMGTHNGPSLKSAWAARLAAALAWVALSSGDAAGLALLRDGVVAHIPARVEQGQWQRILAVLGAASARGRADVAAALDQVIHLASRRGIVAYLGDLFDDEARTLLALATLRARGHEVVVLHLLDPWEEELPDHGDWRLSDLETGETLEVSAAAVRERQRAAVARWRASLHERCQAEGIEYAPCRTDGSIIETLLRLIESRRRRI